VALNLQASDFELFGLPEQFALDPKALDTQWKALQRETHPDKFAAQGAVAQRLAMQWSVRVNEAYQRLKNPTQRAAYLCARRGAAVNAERNTAMPPAFLVQQMEWREELEEANGEDVLEALLDRTQDAQRATLNQIASLLDVQHDASAAATQVRALMFVERFAAEVEQRLDQLGQ
jgi:molecular chaperone HscB